MRIRLPASLSALSCVAAIALAAAVGAQPDRGRVVRPPLMRDADRDGIDDRLVAKAVAGVLIGPAPTAAAPGAPNLVREPTPTHRKPYADLLVCLDHPPGAADIREIEARGGQVVRAWRDLVYCLNVRLSPDALAAGAMAAVSAAPGVTWIEENHSARLMLHYSTRQTRARAAWTRTTAVDGDPAIRIAVCDTGLDGTFSGSAHADLSGKIAAWYDAYYAIHGTGTNYTSAGDPNGHGSHVGGIVAGTGAAAAIDTGNGTLNRTHAAYFNATSGNVWNVGAARMPIDTTGIGANSSVSSSTRWFFSAANTVLAELWDSTFPAASGSLNWGFKSSSDTQPLAVSYSLLATGTQDFAYFGSSYPASDNAGDCWYVSQNACRQVAVGDGYNLNAGVAPACSLVGVRVVDEFGSGNSSASELIEGLTWISTNRATHGIAAANVSLGYGSGPGGALDTAVDSLVGNGVVCVVSAGNDRGTSFVGEPGTASRALTVGAMSEVDRVTSYSSVGGVGSGKPDVVAPGGSLSTNKDITSVDTGDGDYIKNYAGGSDAIDSTDYFADDYAGKSGTSMAAPHVAGVVGLIVDAMGGIGEWDFSMSQALLVKSVILMTATETNQTAEATPNPTLDRGAKDTSEGYGRINADAAVSAVADTLAIAGDGSAAATAVFESGATGRKCWARNVLLSRGAQYDFAMTVPSGCDADLYLYQGTPDANGDPVIAASSTTASTSGNTESLSRAVINAASIATDTYYLVAKLVSGAGSCDIGLDVPTPVRVSDFSVRRSGREFALEWSVDRPEIVAGFNVYRAAAPAGPWTRCNGALIVPQGRTGRFALPGGNAAAYRLESIDLFGNATDHGVVSGGRVAP